MATRKKKSTKKKSTKTKKTKATKKKKVTKSASKRATKKKPTKKKSTKSKKKSKKKSSVPKQTVEGYVKSLSGWQKDAVKRVRTLVKQAAPQAEESIKWSQPVYSLNGPFAWVKAFANHVSVGFWRGLELPDPKGLLESSGAKMAHLKIRGLPEIKAREIQRFVKEAVKLNKQKGDPTQKKG